MTTTSNENILMMFEEINQKLDNVKKNMVSEKECLPKAVDLFWRREDKKEEKNYQHFAEKFYDLIKLNNEFREYDFKKNLEIKTHLCEAAEKLADEEDVIL